MKKTIITILLALVATTGWAQVPLESVKELTMKSEYFNHERQVLIYTPDNYPNFDQTYYDVIYVFDAQDRTMFDLVHCLLNIACKPDPDGGRSQSFIIVGICSQTYGTSTISVTTTTCLCPYTVITGYSGRVITMANRPT